MALLDFMKQGTQWLTDNTGMDWNTVQRDPGLAAKRLMGGEVSPYQAQPTQANLLDVATPEKIVVDPAMQNRMTYNSPQSDAEFFPDYRTVQNTSSLDDLYGNNNGWDRNRKEAQKLNFDNRITYQNLPQKKEDYQAGVSGKDKLYQDYPMLGFTEIAPGLRASEPIAGGYSKADRINAEEQRKLKEEQDAIKKAEQDAINLEFNPHPNMTADGFRPTPNGKPIDVVNFDQNDIYKTNKVKTNDGVTRELGNPFEWIWEGLPGFGKNDEGYAVDKTPYDAGIIPKKNVGLIPDVQNVENKLELPENAKFKLDDAKARAAEIDALDAPDATKIQLYQEYGIPVPDKYGMKGLLTGK